MDKTCFLDMGVIVGFLVYAENEESQIDDFSLPCTNFLENEKRLKVSCCSIIDNEMPKFINRWKIMSKEIRKKLSDKDYKMASAELYPRDLERAEKIYLLKNKIGIEKLNESLLNVETVLEIRFDYVKNKMLMDIVVPEKEIDEELRSHFQALTGNYSDSKVIASAIQYNTNTKNVLLVTTDKKDFKDIAFNLKMREKFDHYAAPELHIIKKQKKC